MLVTEIISEALSQSYSIARRDMADGDLLFVKPLGTQLTSGMISVKNRGITVVTIRSGPTIAANGAMAKEFVMSDPDVLSKILESLQPTL